MQGRFRYPALITLLLYFGIISPGYASDTHRVAKTHTFALYSVAQREQFINNNDDEARGDINNPFGTHNSEAAGIIDEHSNGPYAGDEGIFTFRLYKTAALKKPAGTAVFTCMYYVAKSAFCTASFELSSKDSLIGAGAFSFEASTYALAITGGSGGYSNIAGDVEATPSGKHAEHLTFRLG